MDNNKRNIGAGLTFWDLIQVAFIVLKLCGVIDWSWWLVLAPLWISLGLLVILFLIFLILNNIN